MCSTLGEKEFTGILDHAKFLGEDAPEAVVHTKLRGYVIPVAVDLALVRAVHRLPFRLRGTGCARSPRGFHVRLRKGVSF